LDKTRPCGIIVTVPAWATILIALGSGLFGTVISTGLRISYERDVELRSRVLQAVDEFCVETIEVFHAVAASLLAREEMSPRDEATYESAVSRTFEVARGVVRIRLLLGPSSDAARFAADTVAALRNALEVVAEWPPPDYADRVENFWHLTEDERDEATSEAFEEACGEAMDDARTWERIAAEAYDSFMVAALDQIKSRPWYSRFARAVQRSAATVIRSNRRRREERKWREQAKRLEARWKQRTGPDGDPERNSAPAEPG
jgi:hypothetical protein